MYEAFYGLREKPFNLTPDPKYLFLSEKHREAFAHLVYGIKNGNGFVLISGEIGTGKTTITRNLLQQLDDETEVAFIFNPSLAPVELLKKINQEFGVDARSDTVLGLVDRLNVHLLEANTQGKSCVLVIDEAQNLSPQVLEQIRLLSNLETETQKLLQIVLIGQPELMEMLSLHELRQLNQRITARYHLTALDENETIQYIAYRIHVAGGRRKVQFSKAAVKQVFKHSGGTPRMINALCDRALLIGYTREVRSLTPEIVRQAAREVWGDPKKHKPSPVTKHKEKTPRRSWQLGRFLPNPTVSFIFLVLVFVGIYFAPMAKEFVLEWQKQSLALRMHASDNADTLLNETDESIESEVSAAANMEPSQASVPPFLERLANWESNNTDENESPDILDELQTVDVDNTLIAALTPIFRYWGVDILNQIDHDADESELRKFAEAHGLALEIINPALEQVFKLNVPVLITMRNDIETESESDTVGAEQHSMWVAVMGRDNGSEKVKLASAENEVATPYNAFRQFYSGPVYVFWQDSEPNAPALRLGRSGNAVDRLKGMLREHGRLPDSNRNNQYDTETATAVAELQAETGLTVDGIAGRQVRMVLSAWARNADGSDTTEGSLQIPTPTRVQPSPVIATLPDEQEVLEPEPETEQETIAPAEVPSIVALAAENTPNTNQTETQDQPEPDIVPDTLEAVEVAPPAVIEPPQNLETEIAASTNESDNQVTGTGNPISFTDVSAEAPDSYVSPLWPSPFSPPEDSEEDALIFQGDQSPLPQPPGIYLQSPDISTTEDNANNNDALVHVRELPEMDFSDANDDDVHPGNNNEVLDEDNLEDTITTSDLTEQAPLLQSE